MNFYNNLKLGELCDFDVDPSFIVIRSDNKKSIGSLHSYRGYYDHLAFAPSNNIRTIGEVIEDAKMAIGKTFSGWKGGEFKMTINTPLWVSAVGAVSHKAISGLKIKDNNVILKVRRVYG